MIGAIKITQIEMEIARIKKPPHNCEAAND
jgi:hypothetical protein